MGPAFSGGGSAYFRVAYFGGIAHKYLCELKTPKTRTEDSLGHIRSQGQILVSKIVFLNRDFVSVESKPSLPCSDRNE